MPKPQSDKRDKAYTVRYNDEETKLIEHAANLCALEVASWIRMISVQAARCYQPMRVGDKRRRK